MSVPWLAIAGEEDELSPVKHTTTLQHAPLGRRPCWFTRGERHAFSGAPSTVHGPNRNTYAYDWLRDRVDGKPAEDVFEWVDRRGTITRRPHPRNQQDEAR